MRTEIIVEEVQESLRDKYVRNGTLKPHPAQHHYQKRCAPLQNATQNHD